MHPGRDFFIESLNVVIPPSDLVAREMLVVPPEVFSPAGNNKLQRVNCFNQGTIVPNFEQRGFERTVQSLLELFTRGSSGLRVAELGFLGAEGGGQIIEDVPRLDFPEAFVVVHGILHVGKRGTVKVIFGEARNVLQSSRVVAPGARGEREPTAGNGSPVGEVGHPGRNGEVVPLVE